MQHWKRTTEIANRLFNQGDLVDAREPVSYTHLTLPTILLV